MDRLLPYIQAHPLLVAATAICIALALVFEVRARRHGFSSVSAQEAIRLMNQGAQLLDLRGAEAFKEGHIVGARSMPQEQLAKPETQKKWKDKTLVLYCESGAQAGAAMRALHAAGFTKVFNLRGGLAAWRGESLPVERG
jgi:rhodanese-related sulfurtransferase